MNNKKGISAIVATVLIILITVAAVTIIWAAIIPMITEEIGGATECFDASAAVTVVSDYSCFTAAVGTCSEGAATAKEACEATMTCGAGNDEACAFTITANASVDIQIGRNTGDFDLLGIDVQGSYKGTGDTVQFNGTNVPNANGKKVYTVVVSEDANATQFDLAGIDEASVAARVATGQTETLCAGSAVIPIVACN